MNDGSVLHGGARRLPLRLILEDRRPPQKVSWYEIAPGEACTVHVHEGKTETWLIIAGEGVAQIGASSVPVTPGDMLITESGTPHGLRNVGASPLRFVNIVSLVGAGPVTTRELAGS